MYNSHVLQMWQRNNPKKMFIEPTITQVPSGFSGFNMARYKNCVKNSLCSLLSKWQTLFDCVGTSSSVTPGMEAAGMSSLTDGIRQIIDNAGILSVSDQLITRYILWDTLRWN